uniref:Uncharacterized protein n=1 Tax=Macaca fascicularis TaxID=9541 RepID=A0A7N9DAR7_MACFA
WRLSTGLFSPRNKLQCLSSCLINKAGSGVHVQNVQVCYTGIHVPWWFAAPINPSSTINISSTSI